MNGAPFRARRLRRSVIPSRRIVHAHQATFHHYGHCRAHRNNGRTLPSATTHRSCARARPWRHQPDHLVHRLPRWRPGRAAGPRSFDRSRPLLAAARQRATLRDRRQLHLRYHRRPHPPRRCRRQWRHRLHALQQARLVRSPKSHRGRVVADQRPGQQTEKRPILRQYRDRLLSRRPDSGPDSTRPPHGLHGHALRREREPDACRQRGHRSGISGPQRRPDASYLSGHGGRHLGRHRLPRPLRLGSQERPDHLHTLRRPRAVRRRKSGRRRVQPDYHRCSRPGCRRPLRQRPHGRTP